MFEVGLRYLCFCILCVVFIRFSPSFIPFIAFNILFLATLFFSLFFAVLFYDYCPRVIWFSGNQVVLKNNCHCVLLFCLLVLRKYTCNWRIPLYLVVEIFVSFFDYGEVEWKTPFTWNFITSVYFVEQQSNKWFFCLFQQLQHFYISWHEYCVVFVFFVCFVYIFFCKFDFPIYCWRGMLCTVCHSISLQ